MLGKLTDWGPVTVLLILIVVVLTIVGGVITVVNPETLTFDAYLDKVQEFLIALGILGVARGAKIGLERSGSGAAPTPGDIAEHPDFERQPQETGEDEAMGTADEPDTPRKTV